jgi:hypothetical protein
MVLLASSPGDERNPYWQEQPLNPASFITPPALDSCFTLLGNLSRSTGATRSSSSSSSSSSFGSGLSTSDRINLVRGCRDGDGDVALLVAAVSMALPVHCGTTTHYNTAHCLLWNFVNCHPTVSYRAFGNPLRA